MSTTAHVITVSNRVSAGEREDLSGRTAVELLEAAGLETTTSVVPDGADEVESVLPETDLLVMVLPSTPETTGILSAERIALLPRLSPVGFDWLVPGMREELLTAARGLTGGDVIALTLRFIDLSYIFTALGVESADRDVVVRLDGAGLPADLADFLVDRDLFAVHAVLSELVPGGLPFTRVALGGERAPEALDAYAERLGVRPALAGTVAGATVVFAASHLDSPLPQGSPAGVAVAESMCSELAASRRARGLVGQRVRVEITRTLSRGASMDAVAAALGVKALAGAPSASPQRATRAGSKPSKAARKLSRFFKMVIQLSPA